MHEKIFRFLKCQLHHITSNTPPCSSLCSNDLAVNAEALRLKMHIAEVPETRKSLAGGAHEGWVYEISNQL
jgi:hypothetical protein